MLRDRRQTNLDVHPQSHLRWERVHLVGHSMGGMAAMKLAAAQPSRIASLTIISSTGGGWEAIPSTWRAIRYAWMVWLRPSMLPAPHVQCSHDIR